MNKDAGITVVFGRRGAGKTTYVRHAVKGVRRMFVWDPMEEWEKPGRGVAAVKRLSHADILPMFKAGRSKDFRVCYTPTSADTAAHFETLCRALFALQKPYKDGKSDKKIWFVVDEIDVVYHHGLKAGHPFEDIVRRGRHYGIEVVAATQFPTQVKPDLRRNADRTVSFALSDASAADYVAKAMGGEYRDTVRNLKDHEAVIFEKGKVTKWRNPPPK